MGLDAIILVFWMLSFKPAFSLSSFTFNKRLFSFSSLSAIRLVSPAYLSQTSSEFLSFCFHLGSLRSRNWNTVVGGAGVGITPALDWFPLETFFFFNIRNEYTSSLFKAQLFWILITYNQSSVQFSSVQSLSRVQLFATPWTTPHQASLSITNSRSPPKPNFIPTNSESYQDWEDLQDKFNSKATANTLRWAREAEVFPNQRGRNEVNKDSGAAMRPNEPTACWGESWKSLLYLDCGA